MLLSLLPLWRPPWPKTGIAAAYVQKSGKSAGKFSRKVRNCKIYSDTAFKNQICIKVKEINLVS
jgi:hypothetical protein